MRKLLATFLFLIATGTAIAQVPNIPLGPGGVSLLGPESLGNGIPAFVPTGALFFADFIANNGYSGGGATTSTAQINVSRASIAAVYNTNGSISTVGNNVARLSASEVLPEMAGLLVEQSTANGPGAVDFTTAVVGVLGSGGALPTGVLRDQDSTGLTLTVTEKDASGFQVKYTGTANGGLGQLVLGTGAFAPAATATMSFNAQLVSGSWTNLGSIFISIEEYNSGAAWTNRVLFGAFEADHAISNQFFNTDIPWVVEFNNQIISANVATAGPAFVFLPASSGPVNAEFRFERPQIEPSTIRTTYQPAATRSADNVTGIGTSALLSAAPYSIVVTADGPRESGTGTIWEANDGTSNNYVSLYLSNWQIKLKITSSSSVLTDTAIAFVPAMGRFSTALSVSSTGFAASVNGKPVITGSLTPPSASMTENFGNGQAGYLNGFIQNRTLYNTAKNNTQLASLSIPPGVFWDDFGRANGAPGTAPTGQPWVQIPNSGNGIVLATIASDVLTTADSGFSSTASYSGYDMGSGNVPKILAATVIFSTGTGGFGGDIISNPEGLTTTNDITDQSNHTGIGWGEFDWTVFKTQVSTTLDQSNARSSPATDGVTRYQVARIINGNAQINRTMTGQLQRFVDSRFASYQGQYNIWETFSAPTFSFMGFAAVSGR